MNLQQFEAVLEAKHDKSWERYQDGWPELRDRYDLTAALVHGPDILDIGCAQALLGYLLKDRPYLHYTGLDASPTMVKRALALCRLDIRPGYAESLPFGDGAFDTVVMGQVLEHVLDAEAAAREALRVLKPGGRLIASVPADDTAPHGNHLRVFTTLASLFSLFPGVIWAGEGRVHRYWFIWGEKGDII